MKFSKKVAPYIREKNWHPTQKITEYKDGSLEIAMQLSHLFDIRRWILGWGGEADVLSPAELRKAVQTEAKRIIVDN